MVQTCSKVLEEIDPLNVKAFYRMLVGYEKLSEIFKIRDEYKEFKERVSNLEQDHPEFIPLIKRNVRNIKKHRQKEKKMYSGILGN